MITLPRPALAACVNAPAEGVLLRETSLGWEAKGLVSGNSQVAVGCAGWFCPMAVRLSQGRGASPWLPLHLILPSFRAALDGSLLHPALWYWDSPAPVSLPAVASPGGWPASCPPLMASPVPKAVWGLVGTFPGVTAPLPDLSLLGRVLQC